MWGIRRYRLSPRAFQEYKEINKAEFGQQLSDAKAEAYALCLLHLFSLLLCPLPNMPKTKNVTRLVNTRRESLGVYIVDYRYKNW